MESFCWAVVTFLLVDSGAESDWSHSDPVMMHMTGLHHADPLLKVSFTAAGW